MAFALSGARAERAEGESKGTRMTTDARDERRSVEPMKAPASRRWNHNIHYHRLILDAVPRGARSALDVGCGDGLLAAELAGVVPEVTGIDADAAVLDAARLESAEVSWVRGDVMTYEFGGRFDMVASVAMLHHLPDLDAALARLADLTAPGGVLAVVGIARASRPRDAARHLLGAVQHRWLSWRRGVWEHTAPTVWPPPHDYATVQRAAARVLPGAQWRQLLMWRYALIWRKPA